MLLGRSATSPPPTSASRKTCRPCAPPSRRCARQLGREYPLIIGGKTVTTKDKIRSINPANPHELVGLFQKAGKEEVEPAMKAALKAFETWSRTPVEERANLLFRVAEIIRRRKHEFSAWMIFEVSKNYAEADADIAELIDFLRVLRRARRCAWPRPSLRCNCPASATSCGTSRWAWAS